jgi:hypothetical protein
MTMCTIKVYGKYTGDCSRRGLFGAECSEGYVVVVVCVCVCVCVYVCVCMCERLM